ncbi:MAG TPA: type I secretion system permease/ATPase [Methyloprofundus sp.]|nr:type I secretion system permease/ATPase [Methyloprofundus sp.]HIL77999.1 type I secretion system permease/ATPase [Methylococcales bacterium]
MRVILLKCRQYFIYTGIFSFFINILLLTPILFMLNAMDRVISSRSLETLAALAVIAVFALMIEAFLESTRAKLLNRFSLTLHRLLGLPALKKILMIKQEDGNIRHGMEDVNHLQNFITTKGVTALFDMPWIPFYLFILYLFHPLLMMVAISALIILSMLAYWEYRVTNFNQLQVSDYSRLSRDFIATAYRNNEAIAALGMQDSVASRWWTINEDYLNRKNTVENKLSSIKAMSGFVRLNISIVGISVGAYLVIVEGMTAGIMIAGSMLMGRAVTPISSVISAGKSFINAKAAYDRLDKLLAGVGENENALSLPPPQGTLLVERVFFFINKDRNILNGVTFQLEPGECLAVIGSSASGKSTLSKLLVGYYRPSDGFIRLDGADVNLWSKNGLGQHIGYLPQDIQLFPGSVADNICRLQVVKQNEQAIIAAAKKAGVHEMILKLPKGYETEIGDQGKRLSGGQRQRLGIARALYGNPRFIVLDEPNSNLDGEAEMLLIELLIYLKEEGVTVVVVTHKPNLMEVADKVIAMHEGNVVKFGQRDDVLAQIKMV